VPAEGRAIDLNADVGEASDAASIAVERSLLAFVTSVHIACGGHAGDARSMRDTTLAAQEHGVRVGAHPSFPDREGFGRRPVPMAATELSATLSAQIDALMDVAASLDATVVSVKPHGALYAEVGRDRSTCDVMVDVVLRRCGGGTALVLPAGAPAVSWAGEAGLPVLQEGFADRAYVADGSLMSRERPGSVYDDPARAAAQALDLARSATVTTPDGVLLSLAVDTICLHGDSPHAVAMARAVRRELDGAGVLVAAPPSRVD
jgi:5-oxoprolinase (ATP-hydrolysing) subunit A